MSTIKHALPVLALLAAAASARAAGTFVATFDGLPVPASGYDNGGPATNSAGFTDGSVHFGNNYSSDFGGFWSGFAVSHVNNPATAGFGNQYAAITGTGAGGAGNYAVYYSDPSTFIDLPAGTRPVSVDLTNTTYAYLSMKNGDMFAKKFGGATGNDADYLVVTLTGYAGASGSGGTTGSVDFYLADYRFADNAQDYLVNAWTTVDLTALGGARSIGLSFASSDVGQFGINTPTYVALDNFVAIPEPSALGALALPALLLRRRK